MAAGGRLWRRRAARRLQLPDARAERGGCRTVAQWGLHCRTAACCCRDRVIVICCMEQRVFLLLLRRRRLWLILWARPHGCQVGGTLCSFLRRGPLLL